MIGIKWQMDVKFVPKECYVGLDGERFYSYYHFILMKIYCIK